jgi:hypothetical protein
MIIIIILIISNSQARLDPYYHCANNPLFLSQANV